MTTPRVRCYIRISHADLVSANQEHDLQAMAQRLGFGIDRVYTDVMTGAKSDRERPALKEALADAEAREYDVLLIWALDRLSREGIAPMLGYLQRLKVAGVRLLSAKEPWLDTAGPLADLLVAIFAWVAQQERTRLRERVITGMERARRQGVRIGRPSRAVDVQEIAKRRAGGQTWRAIAQAMHCPARTCWRAYKAANGNGAAAAAR